MDLPPGKTTHSEISSNFISCPSALLAAVASSSPAKSIGPMRCQRGVIRTKKRFTCQDNELAAVFIIEAVLAFASKNVGCDLRNILSNVRSLGNPTCTCRITHPKGNRRKFMVSSNWQRKNPLSLRLLRIQKKVLGIKSSSGQRVRSKRHFV